MSKKNTKILLVVIAVVAAAHLINRADPSR